MSAVVLVAAKGGRVGKAQNAHCHLDPRRMGSGHGRCIPRRRGPIASRGGPQAGARATDQVSRGWGQAVQQRPIRSGRQVSRCGRSCIGTSSRPTSRRCWTPTSRNCPRSRRRPPMRRPAAPTAAVPTPTPACRLRPPPSAAARPARRPDRRSRSRRGRRRARRGRRQAAGPLAAARGPRADRAGQLRRGREEGRRGRGDGRQLGPVRRHAGQGRATT